MPPEQLSAVLATIADAMRGGGTTFAMFSESLREYFEQLNALFPAGAPPGFDNFNATVVGLSRSAPQLLDALGKSVVPAATIAENQRNLTALLSAAQGVTDEAQALFAANGDTAKPLVTDLSRTVGPRSSSRGRCPTPSSHSTVWPPVRRPCSPVSMGMPS